MGKLCPPCGILEPRFRLLSFPFSLSLEREIQTIFLFLSSASFLLSPSTFLKEVEICRRVYERNFDWNDSIFVEDERENEKFTGADLWVD